MADARLTHPTRSTLPFHQRQADEDNTQAVANIAPELAVERSPLVHTETRERERTIRAEVSAPRRSRESGTSDWEQALADYADLLESHVDEFQGDGYTLEDDILNISKQGILESVEWSLTPGQPFDLEYEATVIIGRGTLEDRSIDRRNPTVDTGMGVPLRIDGTDLEGMRDLRVRRSVGVNPRAIFDRSTAENNDVIAEEGVQQSVVFEGTHTGTDATRAGADGTLRDLVATKNNVTLETRFPGYDLDGFVNTYNATQQNQFGAETTHYRLEFIEGQRA